jgi:hypothetical protein
MILGTLGWSFGRREIGGGASDTTIRDQPQDRTRERTEERIEQHA